MRKSFVILPAFLLLISICIQAQDYSRLGKLAGEIKDQAEELSKTTERALDRNRQNSSEVIEQAFLAEQVLAGSKLLEKIVGNKFDIGDIRLSANVLSEMSEDFPVSGANGSRWARLKDKIGEMMFELRRGVAGPAPPVVDETGEIEESRILGRFFWNGEVDAEVHLSVRGTKISSRTISGRQLENGAYSFTAALPKDDGITVRVFKKDGRGEVNVIQQPDGGNDYTAVIRIWDADGGSKPYSLEIFWF